MDEPGRVLMAEKLFNCQHDVAGGVTRTIGCDHFADALARHHLADAGCPTISASTSSRDVDEIRKSSNPCAPGDATLSNCMSSNWFRVMWGWGSISAT
jgi:hypothetical protein